MATAPALLSVDTYLHTSYRPDVDFIAGELRERSVGEFEHGRMQWLIGLSFGNREKEWNLQGVIEQRIRISDDRLRVCDLVLLRADARRERVITTPPLVCIEILSPEDRLSRAKEVLGDYLRFGVQNSWLIDPLRRAAFTFDVAGLHETDPTQLTVPGPPIYLDLTEAFAAMD